MKLCLLLLLTAVVTIIINVNAQQTGWFWQE